MSVYYGSDPEALNQRNDGACSRFLRYTWKTITFFFSHITLVSMVVSYCILGAVTFEALEKGNEVIVKKNISYVRNLTMDKLWNITINGGDVLMEDWFIDGSLDILKDFEQELIRTIKERGWDGNEDVNKVQWNFAGALFYSIIVITTIGYGHIAPKTDWGKVVTIFYAILGIPLMLLCLSNIGDIMATSFRFLYWKVCCYACTKRPKRPKRGRSTRAVSRLPPHRTWRSRTTSFRRSTRTSTRSQDSGFGRSEFTPTSHSDTELRYHDDMPKIPHTIRSASARPSQKSSRFSDRLTTQQDATLGYGRNIPSPKQSLRGGSLDRRKPLRNFDGTLDTGLLEKTSVYCNRYAMEKVDPPRGNHVSMRKFERATNHLSPSQGRRAVSMPRTTYLEPPRSSSPPLSFYSHEPDVESMRGGRKNRRREYNPSPAIMSPLGYGHRSKYLDDPESDDEYIDDYYDMERVRTKPVPIWLCVFLVISYIIAGTFLFAHWEQWSPLNAAYFCFITLTTIGFGDLFPSQRIEEEDGYKQNIAFCSLYLLFGIALLAMSFNLVQEEVIANVKKVARTLGIIKKEVDDEYDD